jgi:hypothetical protein
MRRILCLSGVVMLGLALCGAEVDAQKKDKKAKADKDAVKATAPDYAQIKDVRELTGKLTAADARSITFRLETQHMEPNPAYKPAFAKGGTGGIDLNRRYEEIARDYADIARARNARERERRIAELQRDIARFQTDMARAMAKASTPPKAGKGDAGSPFRVVTTGKDFDFDLTDTAVVRWNKPPFAYDDKGDVKVYKKEELTELKGKDPKLPGYNGKIEDLVLNQTVKIYLVPPPKAKAKLKDGDKAKDEKAKDEAKAKEEKALKLDDLEAVPSDRPTVRMVLILEEAPGLSFSSPGEKKKK